MVLFEETFRVVLIGEGHDVDVVDFVLPDFVHVELGEAAQSCTLVRTHERLHIDVVVRQLSRHHHRAAHIGLNSEVLI